MIDLYSMTEEELLSFFLSLGEPKFRAKQVFTALHSGVLLENITTIPKKLRESLKETVTSATDLANPVVISPGKSRSKICISSPSMGAP